MTRLMMQVELISRFDLDPREVEKPEFAVLMHSNLMGCTLGKVRVLNCWDAEKSTSGPLNQPTCCESKQG